MKAQGPKGKIGGTKMLKRLKTLKFQKV